MIPAYARAFNYSVPWKSSSVHFGGHKGTQRGLGFEFRGNVPLVDYPDARRMDIRQTIRDPFEQVHVKVFNQDNTTPIFAVCDLSASMQFAGSQRKMDVAKEVAASIAYSAYEAGDVFSFIGYDDHVLDAMTVPLSNHIHQAFDVIDTLGGHTKMNVGSNGVTEVPQYLSQNRGLVFWISDFHMPLLQIEQAMNRMSKHQVVPVVLWDDDEYRRLPAFGFGTMIDPETGRNRTIFFRRDIRDKFLAAFDERKHALEKLFLTFESPPLFMDGQYNPLTVSNYFEQWMTS